MALSEYFWASCSWRSEGLFVQSFSIALSIQTLRGLPCLGFFSVVWSGWHIVDPPPPPAGVLLCRRAHQTLKGAPWVGSYSLVQHISHLKEHPDWGPIVEFHTSGTWWTSLSVVQLPMLAHGEREAMVMALPAMCDSAISLFFYVCLTFLHKHFPPQSPPSHPLCPSLHSWQQLSPWDSSTNP